jgi:toxin ParE1/3/4
LKGYPHLVFYAFVDGADHVDVWRVLHDRRDIPASLSGGG